MADILVGEGYANAGYEYINVDDCWLEKERSIFGELVPDRTRFPRGMKSLADYVSLQLLPLLLSSSYCYMVHFTPCFLNIKRTSIFIKILSTYVIKDMKF